MIDKKKQDALKALQNRSPARETENGVTLIQSVKQVQAAREAAYAWAYSDLIPGGTLAKTLPYYKYRNAQIEMAARTGQAIQEGRNLFLEAPTGTGKSLAYLIPAVRSGKVTVISTATKALQGQIFEDDVPFVQKHIQPFEAALLKGRSNYVCLDLLDKVIKEEAGASWDENARQLVKVVTEDTSFNGDFEELSFTIDPELKGKVEADSNQCAWNKCNLFQSCYVRKMKEQVKNAQVIITNHTTLMIDAQIEKLLPPRQTIVIDEAHHLENAATQALTTEIRYTRVTSLLALKRVKKYLSIKIIEEVTRQLNIVWEILEEHFSKVSQYGSGVTLHDPIQEGLRLASHIEAVANELDSIENRPGDLTEKEQELYNKTINRARELALDLHACFSVSNPSLYVYHLEKDKEKRGKAPVYIARTPLDVSSFLSEALFEKSNTVICTSATLATSPYKGKEFEYFLKRTGGNTYSDNITRVLDTVFEYESNALLYIPERFPEPVHGDNEQAHSYERAISREMLRLVKASRGRAFLLFCSKKMLDLVYREIAPLIPYPVLRQGDMPNKRLQDSFKGAGNAVLFGTKTFWEGIDIAGDALSLVVIDKLPFYPPDEPVGKARVSAIEAAGGNKWTEYILPRVTLQLKQGVGRLIRRETDRGVMAILDARLFSKSYGEQVRASLPPAYLTQKFQDVENFFSER